MGLLADIVALFKGNREPYKEWQAIVREIKEIKEDHKSDAKDQKAINQQLKKQNDKQQKLIEDLTREVEKVKELEMQCLEGQRVMQQLYIDTQERLIFMTKGKHKGDDIP